MCVGRSDHCGLLTSPRQWVISDAGTASRLPPCGPSAPVNSSVLLLITQALFINACFLPPYVPSLKILRVPLSIPSKIKDSEPPPEYPSDKQGGGGRRLCVSATIGIGYNGIFSAHILCSIH